MIGGRRGKGGGGEALWWVFYAGESQKKKNLCLLRLKQNPKFQPTAAASRFSTGPLLVWFLSFYLQCCLVELCASELNLRDWERSSAGWSVGEEGRRKRRGGGGGGCGSYQPGGGVGAAEAVWGRGWWEAGFENASVTGVSNWRLGNFAHFSCFFFFFFGSYLKDRSRIRFFFLSLVYFI